MERVPSIGENLARLRRRRGLTQEGLAERAAVSVSVIRKLERGDRDTASLPTLRKLATALGMTTVDLFHPAPTFAGRPDENERDDLYALRRALQPARVVGGGTASVLADEDEHLAFGDIEESARQINGLFRDSDYTGAVAALPTALVHGRAAVSTLDGDAARAGHSALSEIYQTAAMVLTQLSKLDLAYFAVGAALESADRAEDRVLAGAVVCCENWILTVQARYDDAEMAATVSAETIEPSFSRSTQRHWATFGWLCLGAAAAAARNGRLDAASDAMRQAEAAARIAAGYDSPRVEHWSRFDSDVVAMRGVELAIVAGQPDDALRRAQTIPADARPAVTRQRCWLDIAAAHVDRNEIDDALAILLTLKQKAPGWLRVQRYARVLTRRMLHQVKSRTVPGELREMADFLGVVD